jgi:Secretion system C-terminal sorting domain
MKKIYTLFLICLVSIGYSQTTINFDPASMDGTGWIGYMTVFNLPADGEGYQFEGGWGTADLVAQDNMDGTVSLKPNRIGDPDPYWQGTNPAGNPTGNKMMEATYYLQDDALAGTDFTFNAEVISNTLNSTGLDVGFTVVAFIKVFSNDFSSVTVLDSYNLANGNFTLTHNASDSDAGTGPGDTDHIQYGFTVYGPNIRLNTDTDPNPGFYDDDYAALGSIDIGPNTTLSANSFELSQVKAFPNPTNNVWNINTNNQNIQSIAVYDVLGKEVFSSKPNASQAIIDSESLSNGLYFAKVKTINGESNLRLVKN